MTSPPFDSKHDRTTSGVACHHRLRATQTIERRQEWHAIIAFGQHTRSNDVGRGMPSSPFGNTHCRTTSGVACNHRLWEAHTVERRQAWLAIIAFRLADTVGRRRAWHAIIVLNNKHGRTKSGVACHHRLWAAHTIERLRAWYTIIAFGKLNGRTTSGVA